MLNYTWIKWLSCKKLEMDYFISFLENWLILFSVASREKNMIKKQNETAWQEKI